MDRPRPPPPQPRPLRPQKRREEEEEEEDWPAPAGREQLAVLRALAGLRVDPETGHLEIRGGAIDMRPWTWLFGIRRRVLQAEGLEDMLFFSKARVEACHAVMQEDIAKACTRREGQFWMELWPWSKAVADRPRPPVPRRSLLSITKVVTRYLFGSNLIPELVFLTKRLDPEAIEAMTEQRLVVYEGNQALYQADEQELQWAQRRLERRARAVREFREAARWLKRAGCMNVGLDVEGPPVVPPERSTDHGLRACVADYNAAWHEVNRLSYGAQVPGPNKPILVGLPLRVAAALHPNNPTQNMPWMARGLPCSDPACRRMEGGPTTAAQCARCTACFASVCPQHRVLSSAHLVVEGKRQGGVHVYCADWEQCRRRNAVITLFAELAFQ